jgi:hypothetical protein
MSKVLKLHHLSTRMIRSGSRSPAELERASIVDRVPHGCLHVLTKILGRV